ncbi:terminase TerL endonuclease subunit [Paraburkholderia phymatum]|uniref:Terminase n=1 Tax=Paraburkholderia phymatum (strain DSM 17167 / CIP 108236 / LMG 21445 / STM815) TaxID=391038 RepID=B2JU88_PARP8|nr:terminase TerL endonuclease subunit [Paraburkholderia phymatum]ACC76141.1 Terminase [Paraburkholderia phymatum STM815]
MANPHVVAANKYARDVIAGKVPAGKYVRGACARHLADLDKSKSKSYPFVFDAAAGERACAFIEKLPHTKGKWARMGERLVLSPWQCFIIVCVFGWKRRKNGMRRFRELYAEIPRKNGKSQIGAGIGLYMLIADGEYGAEIYSGATTEKQAWEVFGPARQMMQRTPGLLKAAGAEVWAKSIAIPSDGSRFEPIIGKPGDGSSPSCALIDEFHEHDTPDLIDTMQTGMGAREQPLTCIITTAGYNLAGPCYDKHSESKKVLDGLIENDELFAIIFSIDEEDDWASPTSLQKANPNFDISVDADFLMAQQRRATMNPIEQNRFKTKHLNVWCSARNAWMNMQQWQFCADPSLTLDEFEGTECVFVLDLASKNDICAFVQVFKRELNGQDHYYAFGRYYLPSDAIEENKTNQALYRKWVIQGYLIPLEGAEIDFDVIREDVRAMATRFDVQEVAYDPWRATQLAHQLAKDGATVVEYRQTVQNMSPAMKEVMAAVKAGRFHHDGNPCLNWMVSNVVAKEDAKENIYPRKDRPEQKIDGPVAIMMGVGRLMVAEPLYPVLPDDYSLTIV